MRNFKLFRVWAPIIGLLMLCIAGPDQTLAYDSTNGLLANFGIAEFLIIIIWLVFVAMAFFTRDVYVFAVAAIVSIIFGIDVGILYIKDTVNNWALGIVGFALIFFGLLLMVIGLNQPLKGNRK
jgi:hypothetical protein